MNAPQRVAPDTDSTEIQVYAEQEQSAYNGHFQSTCYQPLLLLNGEGNWRFRFRANRSAV